MPVMICANMANPVEMRFQDMGFKRMNDGGGCGCIGVDMVVVASSNLYRITQGDLRPV